MYIIVLFTLSIVFEFVNIDAGQLAEGLRNSGDYIKGVRSGEDTKRYINKYVWFFSVFGSIYICIIAGSPFVSRGTFPKL
ncbi:MAG: hypothetical protein ACLUA8_06725 [Ligilactobacillus salivarius]